MFWTNLFVCGTALMIVLTLGELNLGIWFCMCKLEILAVIMKFLVCLAIGQSFTFYYF